jgi:hypothetical protein
MLHENEHDGNDAGYGSDDRSDLVTSIQPVSETVHYAHACWGHL